MNVPKLPTDNNYKFRTLLMLVAMVGVQFAYPMFEDWRSKQRYAEYRARMVQTISNGEGEVDNLLRTLEDMVVESQARKQEVPKEIFANIAEVKKLMVADRQKNRHVLLEADKEAAYARTFERNVPWATLVIGCCFGWLAWVSERGWGNHQYRVDRLMELEIEKMEIEIERARLELQAANETNSTAP